jgi:hypothetical protein
MLERVLVALADGELEVTRLEESALSGGQAILIDAGKDLLRRTCDNAALRVQAWHGKQRSDKSQSDQQCAPGAAISRGRRKTVLISQGERSVQWIGLKKKWDRFFAFMGAS